MLEDQRRRILEREQNPARKASEQRRNPVDFPLEAVFSRAEASMATPAGALSLSMLDLDFFLDSLGSSFRLAVEEERMLQEHRRAIWRSSRLSCRGSFSC